MGEILMFNLFGKKRNKKEREVLNVESPEPVDCICDFTFNFHWQHNGEKLDPSWKIPHNDFTFGKVVEHLKNGGDVLIDGDAGHRLASSMGVDLQYFGGSGGDIPVGDVYVEGDVDTRMGISMARGSIYVKGHVNEPMGNLVEVKSQVKGYQKYRSITDIMHHGLQEDRLVGCHLTGDRLIINDKTVKDTVGARLNRDAEIVMNGKVDLSTGILMRKGVVRINGSAGKNSGALLNGGTLIIDGNTDDFTAIDMIKGKIIINGNAGKFMAANKKRGHILARNARPIPPVEEKPFSGEDRKLLLNNGFNPHGFHKFE
jgi:formylmethanofuran dehydrogenase subunit C